VYLEKPIKAANEMVACVEANKLPGKWCLVNNNTHTHTHTHTHTLTPPPGVTYQEALKELWADAEALHRIVVDSLEPQLGPIFAHEAELMDIDFDD
jgi:hypothetical protein